MMSITINIHQEGAIVVVDFPEEQIYNEYAVSPESAMAIYEVIGNVVDLAEPHIGYMPEKKKKRRKK